MDFSISNNADLAKALNNIVNDSIQSGKIGAEQQVTFVGNEKGLTMTYVTATGEKTSIDFGNVELDKPTAELTPETVKELIGFLDNAGLTDKESVEEAKQVLTKLAEGFKTGTTNFNDVTTMADIYQLMALLVKVLQKQRECAGMSREASNAQVIAGIEREAAIARDAAAWGFAGAVVSASFQGVMSTIQLCKACAAVKAMKNCEMAAGVKMNETNLATMKDFGNEAAMIDRCNSLDSSLGDVMSKNVTGSYTAFEKEFNTKYAEFANKPNLTSENPIQSVKGLVQDGKMTLEDVKNTNQEVLSFYKGKLDTATKLFKGDMNNEELRKGLENAQAEYNLAFAKCAYTETAAMNATDGITPEQIDATRQQYIKQQSAEVGEAKQRLADDPDIVKIKNKLQRWQAVGELVNVVGKLFQGTGEGIAKLKEADQKQEQAEEKRTEETASKMDDLYKSSKQMMDEIRNFLSTIVESELETQRRVMA